MGQTCNLGSPPVIGSSSFTNRAKAFGFGSGENAPEFIATPHAGLRSARQQDEPRIPIFADGFRITVTAKEAASSTGFRAGWRSMYALGPMLGDGVSAKVYEAEALTPAPQMAVDGLGAVVWGNCGGKPPCLTERGRRVALKRFHRVGSRTFKKELAALLRVGVHPNILRLLESYEGCDNEDVLVLEYCDGSTVYDLYAREHPHGGLPERMIARLIKQLLLALEHLVSCGVEHQDVKPENMMLHDVSLSNHQAELKLGDFGWAMVLPPPNSPTPNVYKPPSTGAGSLWYAPPELNPPVKGIPPEPEPPLDFHGNPLRGRSDMWSVGVVIYLLLVGHNPFNAALKLQNQDAIDAEVLRLAALGHFNRKAEKWLRLNVDARDFISALLKVRSGTRPSATEALRHPYLTRRLAKTETSVFFHGPVSNFSERETAWLQLDGLQQLGWLAIARAVSEPELDRQAISAALEGVRGAANNSNKVTGADAGYLYQLARELGTSPVSQWLQERSSWTEILRLAFCYLDVDSDGMLSARDLAAHLTPPGAQNVNGDVWAVACRWLSAWQSEGDSRASRGNESADGGEGLGWQSFRTMVLASHANDSVFEAFDAPLASATTAFYMPEESGNIHPSFSRVTAGPHDHDEEEINWTDLLMRGGPQ